MEYIDGHIDYKQIKQQPINMNDKIAKQKIINKMDIEYKPEDVIISTMTITCKFPSKFNVVNIGKYIDLSRNGIVEVICGKDIFRSLIPKKNNSQKNKKEKKQFYNQTSLKINTKKDKLINIKLFINGSIQMTGCKSIEGSTEALQKLLSLLKIEKAIIDTKTFKLEDKPFVTNISKMTMENLYDFKIVMINSNFNIGFLVDRYKLYKYMTKDNIDATYDPIIHAGVIMRYNAGDKIISVFIFEGGSIVITGARTCKHINDAYNFINKYMLQNYKYVVKTNNLSNSTILKYLDEDFNSN